jgi:hypothetical protein
LPGWQQFYEANKDSGVEVLTVAMDAQGPDRPRPYVERAGATFETVVDQENLLGSLYGFRAVPNGYLIDEDGTVRYMKLGGFDVRKGETREALERWLAGELSPHGEDVTTAPVSISDSASHLFSQGIESYNKGEAATAVSLWRQALSHDPDNYIIRKQIWAVENPDRFYAGDIDYDWQREVMAEERG